MSVKEKAQELVSKFYKRKRRAFFFFQSDIKDSRECAIILVDEIISELQDVDINYDLELHFKETCLSKTTIKYWEEVKKEIEKVK